MDGFTDYRNIHEMIKETVDRRRDRPAYRWFTAPGQTEEISWNDFYRQVRQAARALVSLGIEKGDKVTILSYSCYRWVLCDMANAVIGAQTIGIYHSLPRPDVSYIVGHTHVAGWFPVYYKDRTVNGLDVGCATHPLMGPQEGWSKQTAHKYRRCVWVLENVKNGDFDFRQIRLETLGV